MRALKGFIPLKISLLLLSISISSIKSEIITGKTFFSVRAEYQSAMPSRVSFFRNDLLDECPCNFGGAFQFIVFGGKSTDSLDLARYFLPGGCTNGCLRVRETNLDLPLDAIVAQDLDRAKNIEALHFNIETVNGNFNSRVCFAPHQSMMGFGFTYKQRLTQDCRGFTKWWTEISFPVVRIENRMCLEERVFNSGGGAVDEIGLSGQRRVGSMTEAFKQPGLRYARIDNCCDSAKWGVADIELKLGYTTINNDCCRLSSYGGLVIPTGNRPNARYVFESIVGNNQHFGLMYGNSLTICLLEKPCHGLTFNLDTNYRYLFTNCQMRTFDLIGKPWGRYMEVYANKEQAVLAFDAFQAGDAITAANTGTFGANVFTRCAEVTPRFTSDINTGFLYTYLSGYGRLIAEAGYNFFANQSEEIALRDCDLQAALKAVEGEGSTTLARTIGKNFIESSYSTALYQPLTVCDLDISSAAHPSVLSYILYATLGYEWNKECPRFAAIGGSYEGSHSNAVLHRYNVWGKFVFTF